MKVKTFWPLILVTLIGLVIGVVLWLLNVFGLLHSISRMRVGG